MKHSLALIIILGLIFSCKSKYTKALELFENGEIDYAYIAAAEVKKSSKDFDKAQDLRKNIEYMIAEERSTVDSIINDGVQVQSIREFDIIMEQLDLFRLDIYQDNAKGIGNIIKYFEDIENKVLKAKYSYNDDLIKRSIDVQKKVNQIRGKNYPELRKKFKVALDSELNKYGMKINVNGDRNTTIEFISVEYIEEANIDKTMKDLKSLLYDLRYKKVKFKTLSTDSDFKYFNLQSKNDFESSY